MGRIRHAGGCVTSLIASIFFKIFYYPLGIFTVLLKFLYKGRFIVGVLLSYGFIWNQVAYGTSFFDSFGAIARSQSVTILNILLTVVILTGLTWLITWLLFKVVMLRVLEFFWNKSSDYTRAFESHSFGLVNSLSAKQAEAEFEKFKSSPIYSDPMIYYGNKGYSDSHDIRTY